MGARPVWNRTGSYPRIDMLPTSLPGGRPGGITAARPTSPRAASAARFGSAAASSGVRPPSSGTGSSAHPSGTHTTYFTGPVWPTPRPSPEGDPVGLRDCGADEVLHLGRVGAEHLVALGSFEGLGQP